MHLTKNELAVLFIQEVAAAYLKSLVCFVKKALTFAKTREYLEQNQRINNNHCSYVTILNHSPGVTLVTFHAQYPSTKYKYPSFFTPAVAASLKLQSFHSCKILCQKTFFKMSNVL